MSTPRRPGTVALTGLALVVAATSAIAADDRPAPPSEMHWPGEGGKKVEVSLGLFLIGFARINLREESFDMAGYLDLSWTDPGSP